MPTSARRPDDVSAQTAELPRAVAVIPARGGSRGVPGKNVARVGGLPLVARAVSSCLRAETVDAVYVSTDDPEIATAAAGAGARVVERPPELSGDTASSESALLHALDHLAGGGIEPDVVLLAQCTSPFIDPSDVDAAVSTVLRREADCVFSAVETYEFLWRRTGEGATGINHDAAVRPRRQDREPHYRESGAFYAMRVSGFRQARHRFFGRIEVQPVPESHAVEIDTLHDLDMARALATSLDRPEAVDADAVVTDFDGVHTDDTAEVHQDGRESVRVSRRDGMGIAMLRRAGIPVLILSTETNPVVTARARKLQVSVLQGQPDKAVALSQWIEDQGLDPARVAYVGNDVNDLGCLQLVGWPVAVADAGPEVLKAARTVLSRPPGRGAVRELCELVLASREEKR